MFRFIVSSLTLVVAMMPTAWAQVTSPEATVRALFDAMRAGNGDSVRALVRDGAPLQRATPDGVRDITFEDWASWIDTLEPSQADEQIFSVEVKIFGILASVWAPFVISLNGEVAGCGVNHFLLAEEAAGWIVIHGADTPYDGDCGAFRSAYSEDKTD
ncbi:MAG: hypothetical protein AAFS13_09130 [Pseudomonadota bacterium]